MKSAAIFVAVPAVLLLSRCAAGRRTTPCEFDEVRVVKFSEFGAEEIPVVRERTANIKRPKISALMGQSPDGGGYCGLNNQREVLQNMLLVAYALDADILAPLSILLLTFDPRPQDLVRNGVCENVDKSFDAPWAFVNATEDGVIFGPFSSIWNPNRFKAVASEAFGTDVVFSDSCDDYRHIRLDVFDPEPYAPQSDETLGTFALRFRRILQSLNEAIYSPSSENEGDVGSADAQHTNAAEDDREIVYHVNAGYSVFFGGLDPCLDVFSQDECSATDRALEFSVPVKEAAKRVVASLEARAPQEVYDVVHYHDMFCSSRREIFHAMRERDDGVENGTRIVYNIGNPPRRAKGFAKRDFDPDGCATRPFQINAAVEFEVAREAPGVVFGTKGSSFDRYLQQYRALNRLETIIIGTMPDFTNSSAMGIRGHPCETDIAPKSGPTEEEKRRSKE